MSHPITMPRAAWRTPDDWGDQNFFCTWDELCQIAADLRAAGLEAGAHQATQYLLIGDDRRAVPRGWYSALSYSTADGRTIWTQHCVELDPQLRQLREASRSEVKPAHITGDDERAILMRCLANA